MLTYQLLAGQTNRSADGKVRQPEYVHQRIGQR